MTVMTSTLLVDCAEGFTDVDGVRSYVIPDLASIPPFLMSLVSDSDHWCFISSAGALTAGRRDARTALFPYETDDRLHVAAGVVGPATVIRVVDGNQPTAWEPFGRCPTPGTRRALAKSVLGDVLVFEEVNDDLGLAIHVRWATSEHFGFVRRVELVNLTTEPRRVQIADGLVGVLAAGLTPDHYRAMSNLTNAYRRSELVGGPGHVVLHTLEAQMSDQASPAESLRATVTWSIVPESAAVTVDRSALDSVRRGEDVSPVGLMTGRPGAHLATFETTLDGGSSHTWHVLADVAQDHAMVASLLANLDSGDDVVSAIESSVRQGSASLAAKLGSADALQHTGDDRASAHHTANVLFNVMRGGVFVDGYQITSHDFTQFVAERNRQVAAAHATTLSGLPEQLSKHDVIAVARDTGDPDLERLALEYLPLTFSRRHGDPSRPWNRFSIRVREEDGTAILHHEGNWRDIFQNWEALCLSFPGFLPSVVAVFVNASTVDGYNPYRITRHGIDWESPDPDDPWSNIGYWGDHQIVYLLRLLETAQRMLPGAIEELLDRRLFTYADVPYRIKDYDSLVADPRSSILYDEAAAERALTRAEAMGGDGKLLVDHDGDIYRVSLLEKLVVPALSKLSSFVPDGGIWMNTQRPEWNDANNALVGYGLSMVTLYYLRRYLAWLGDIVDRSDLGAIPMSSEIADWLSGVTEVLQAHSADSEDLVDDGARADVMAALGDVFSSYREQAYAGGLTRSTDVPLAAIQRLCELALSHLDRTIGNNRRSDGLYHSYNLVRFEDGGDRAAVEHLPEMLEGQVAALSCGILDADECAGIIEALYSSALYRPDQDSFILYPDRPPPPFLEKNVIGDELVAANPLLAELVAAGDRRVVVASVDGHHHFHAGLSNATDLSEVLDELGSESRWAALVAAQRRAVLDVYEAVFNHHAFTGRSGTMYAYEGLGSIYWHMVAKLLVATQECLLAAHARGDDADVVERLRRSYFRVRGGLGFNKSAVAYGAFPTDPYSHTPAHAGAQQPGMTGQVKEEIVTRTGELGLWYETGEVRFDPVLLRSIEFLAEPHQWDYYDVAGRRCRRELAAGSYGLTICQVPVVVTVTDGPTHIQVVDASGAVSALSDGQLDRATSHEVFARSGAVAEIRVNVARDVVGRRG